VGMSPSVQVQVKLKSSPMTASLLGGDPWRDAVDLPIGRDHRRHAPYATLLSVSYEII
jgi:hypothetical protein